jgi:hypothetical protein
MQVWGERETQPLHSTTRRLNTLLSTHLAALHEAVSILSDAVAEVLLPSLKSIQNSIRIVFSFLLVLAVINYLA